MSARHNRRPFRAAQPLQVVRDNTLGGTPVLLLGYWLGPDGQPEAAQVLTLTSTRRLSDLSGWHGENCHHLELPVPAQQVAHG